MVYEEDEDAEQGGVGTMRKKRTKAADLKSAINSKPVGGVRLPTFDRRKVTLRVTGESELVVHRWSVKAKREIMDKHRQIPSAGREKKNPLADFLETLYEIEPGKVIGSYDDPFGPDEHPSVRIEGGQYAFPSIAFKKAMVDACTSLGKQVITQKACKQAFHVLGELTMIRGQPRMREDMVRLNGTTADVRHRGGFPTWTADVKFTYNARVISVDQLASLLELAGFAVGIGEWRCERDGDKGMFRIGE